MAGGSDFDRWPHEFFGNHSWPIGINRPNLWPTRRITGDSRRAAGNEWGELFSESLDGFASLVAGGNAKDEFSLTGCSLRSSAPGRAHSLGHSAFSTEELDQRLLELVAGALNAVKYDFSACLCFFNAIRSVNNQHAAGSEAVLVG